MTLSFKPALLVLLCSAGLFTASAVMYAQSSTPEVPQPAATAVPAPPSPTTPPAASPSFSSAQIDQWVAPIALYPDPLLSQVLMASTYPANVIQAAQWSHDNPTQQGDAAIQAVNSQPWDPSVKSLVAFPQLIALMGENPSWVENLGDAFLAQPQGVMDSVQKLRRLAQETGALKSTPQQTVSTTPAVVNQTTQVEATPAKTPPPAGPSQTSAQTIIIQPADPQVIYVPNYNPTIVYGTWPNTHYPPTYLPPPPGQQFTDSLVRGFGYSLGIATTYALFSSINWHDDDHHGNAHYDGNYRSNNNINVNVNNYNRISGDRLPVNGGAVAWQHNPSYRAGVPYQSNTVAQRYHQTNVPGGLSATQTPVTRDAQRQAAASQWQQSKGKIDAAAPQLTARDVQREASSQQLNQIAQRNNYRGYDSRNIDARKSDTKKQINSPSTQQQRRDTAQQQRSQQQRRQPTASVRSNALSGNDSRSPSWQAQNQRGQQSLHRSSPSHENRAPARERSSEHREFHRR